MNYSIQLHDIQSIKAIPGYWTQEDYIHILEELEFPDARTSTPSELRELTEMALSDSEPHESAKVLLKYKVGNELTSGQIQNLSHEMADDDESNGNPEIALHYALFSINQLLGTAFPGVFPSTKATQVDFEPRFKDHPTLPVTKELALKALCGGLTEKNPILRLFKDQIHGKEPIGDAEHIVWELHNPEPNIYTIFTSDYWINQEDFTDGEFSGSIQLYEEDE
jgi:hypothetical protein